MSVASDLADHYNFEVTMFHWHDNSFHFEKFSVAG